MILRAPESIVKMPRAVEVMKTRMPRRFEKINVIMNKIIRMKVERVV